MSSPWVPPPSPEGLLSLQTNSALQKAHISNLAFTLAGNNLVYFSEIKGINPELGSSNTYGTGFRTYPPIRKISFGIKATF